MSNLYWDLERVVQQRLWEELRCPKNPDPTKTHHLWPGGKPRPIACEFCGADEQETGKHRDARWKEEMLAVRNRVPQNEEEAESYARWIYYDRKQEEFMIAAFMDGWRKAREIGNTGV